MATITLKPIVHHLKEVSVGKWATTRHFEVESPSIENSFLGNSVCFNKDRGFAKSNPDSWVKIKGGKEGKTFGEYITGFFKYKDTFYFWGDRDSIINGKRQKLDLLIFFIQPDSGEIIVYYYPRFDQYTTNWNNGRNRLLKELSGK
jgi:hypothetical protein